MDTRRQTLWLVATAAISIAALAVVHALQSFGGYLPCELCLRQREVYWTALAIALAALAIGRVRRVAIPVGVVAVGVAFAVGAVLAAYHAGVEWKWWPGPTACTGAARGTVSAASVLASLDVKQHMVRCDEAALRIAGVSLSGWNALASAALSITSFLVLRRRTTL